VPWWKGVPALVVAPSSIEAEAWRRQLRAAQEASCEPLAPPLERGGLCRCHGR
jgi:hypothetical protein